ncbi:F-box protein-like [Dorcoceras hygrometricum]|uniref:F-box protein-like n=1 Tax=Dorcoceras hygrometricum TaxID=472368 RepID=A0A2Z7BTT0_9LAMI|nr:F-box protein-like [Dorcoceras hygrometricum]
MGCYASFPGIQNAGSIKLVQQLDEIEEKSSSAEEMKCRTDQVQIRCSVKVWCSSADPSCFNERIDELEVNPTIGAEEKSVRNGYSISPHRAKLVKDKLDQRRENPIRVLDAYERWMLRQESASVNNVDSYDDVKAEI